MNVQIILLLFIKIVYGMFKKMNVKINKDKKVLLVGYFFTLSMTGLSTTTKPEAILTSFSFKISKSCLYAQYKDEIKSKLLFDSIIL